MSNIFTEGSMGSFESQLSWQRLQLRFSQSGAGDAALASQQLY
jgi:hypothetical protein